MKLLLFLLLLPSVSAVGIAPASLEFSADPGEQVIKKLWVFDDPVLTPSQPWITIMDDTVIIDVPEDAEGLLQEYIRIANAQSAVQAEAAIPISIIVNETAFPLAMGFLVSASIIIVGLAAYAVIENNL